MKNTKPVQILSSFSEVERKDFMEYAQTTYLNPNKKILPLLETLYRYLKNATSMDWHKAAIYQQAYPNRSFDASYLRKQLSILFNLLKQYLIDKAHRKQDFTQQLSLIKQLQERDLNAMAALEINRQEGKQKKHPIKDANFHFQQFLLAEQADIYFGKRQQRVFDIALQEKVDALDAYYFSQKIKSACEMYNRARILSQAYQIRFIDEIISYLNKNPHLKQIPSINIYLQILQTLQSDDALDAFHELTDQLKKYANTFTKEEAAAMYRYAQNYCIRMINQGQVTFYQALFQLYKNQLAQGVNIRNGIIAADDAKNMVTVGLKLKEFAWVEQFIYERKENLSEAVRENVFHYNLAAFYYAKRDFDAAVQLLNSIRFTDIFYEISGKLILAKIYYLEGEIQPLIYLADAFKLNLQRNKKIAADYRIGTCNFLIQLKKLGKLKANQSFLKTKVFVVKCQILKERIASIKPLIDRKWLLQMLQELMPKRPS